MRALFSLFPEPVKEKRLHTRNGDAGTRHGPAVNRAGAENANARHSCWNTGHSQTRHRSTLSLLFHLPQRMRMARLNVAVVAAPIVDFQVVLVRALPGIVVRNPKQAGVQG